MNKEYYLHFLLILPVIVIQIYVLPLLEIAGIAPDLIAIYVLYVVLKSGQIQGMFFGGYAGLVFALVSFQLLGGAMFSLSLSAFILGYFYSEIRAESFVKSGRFIYLTILFAFINNLTYSLLTAYDVSFTPADLAVRMTFLPAVYTAVLASVIAAFFPKRYLTI
ncbi:MAG: rod shape-determining protein MreD [Ignavibacteriaceae bacterium]|nr:rod shape-determining protein MreD [Ignavibacteriaceae bacterium]